MNPHRPLTDSGLLMTTPTEFAPGLVLQSFTSPLRLSDFKLIAFDMVGLAQLHQLRVRVGRSHH